MTKLPPPPPPAKRGKYVYAAVDITRPDEKGEPEVLFVELTRRAARDKVIFRKDADNLRIRRARIFLYES